MIYKKSFNSYRRVIAIICALIMICAVVLGNADLVNVLALSFGTPQTQMLNDGNFESGEFGNGWEIKENAGNQPVIINGNFTDGDKLLSLTGESNTVYQKFEITKDKVYVLEFAYANSNGGTAERFIDVDISSESNNYLHKTYSSIESPYSKESFAFKGKNSETVTLSFSHSSFETVYIDNVSVKTASEIIVGEMNGGTVVTDKSAAVKGQNVTVTVFPHNGMELKNGTLVYATEEETVALTPTDSADVYTFEMPESSVTVKAEFSNTVVDSVLGTEIISDGAFSEGIGSNKPWKTVGIASALYSSADSTFADNNKIGDKCVKINKNRNGIIQKEIDIKGGYIYEFSFLLAGMVSSGGASSTINVKIINENDNVIYSETVSSSGYKYEKITRQFTTESDAKVTVSFDRKDSQGSTSIYIDDISLIAVEKITELIKNGTFDEDNSASGWTVYTNWSTALSVPHSGYKGIKDVLDNAIKISAYGGGFNQKITLEKNKSYVLSFNIAAGATGGVKNFVDIYIKTSSDITVFEKTFSSYNYPYAQVTYNFVSNIEGEATLRFDRQNYNGTDVFIDDVSLKPSGVEKAEFKKQSLIKNGDFESVYDGTDGDGKPGISATDWNLRWKAKINATHPNSGKYCANIAQYSGGISQNVELVAGAKYRLGFFYNPNTSDGSSRALDITLGENLNKKVVFEGTEYKYYSFDFVASKSGDATLIFSRADYAGDAFVDDISLETIAYVGDDFLINGSFEETIKSGNDVSGFVNSDERGWYATENVIISDEEAPCGKKSLKLSGEDTKGIYGVFDVDKNAPIRFVYKYKGSIDAKAEIKITTDIDGNNILYNKSVTGSDLWEEYSTEFETNSNCLLYIHITSSNGENLFDCFSLYKLARVELIVRNGGTASLNKSVVLPDEMIFLNIDSLEDGVSIPNGSPSYISGMSVGAMKTIVENSVYAMIAPDDDITITLYFDMPVNSELITDGGFESGTFVSQNASSSGWAADSNFANIVNGSFRGNHSVSVKTGNEKAIYQTDIHLQAGSTYRLSYYHSGCSYNAGVYIMKDETTYFTEPLLCGDDDEWNRYSIDFIASESAAVTIVLKNTIGLENAVFDNISLMKVEPNSVDQNSWKGNYDVANDSAPTGSELLRDGSFEKHGSEGMSADYWTIYSEAIFEKISYSSAIWAVSDGKYAACIAAGASEALYQAVTLKPYSAYNLTFDYIVDKEGCSVSVGPNLARSNEYGENTTLKPTNEPSSGSIVFVTGETGEAVVLLTNKSGKAAYFDNLSLKEIDNTVSGDLGFRFSAYIKATEVSENSLDIVWSAAKSKIHSSKELNYSVYCSQVPITEKNYKDLQPLLQHTGEKVRRLKVTDLNDGTDYYFAIVVTDPSGNTAFLIPKPIKTLKTPGYTLVNPSFELGTLEGWNDWQNNKVKIMAGGSDGKYMVRFLDWAFRIDQQILAYPDSEYVFSFDAMHPATVPLNYGFQIYDGKSTQTVLKGMVESTTTWEKYIGTFSTTSSTERVTVYFGNGEDYTFAHLDNIYLKKIENKDLYFVSSPQLCIAGDNYVIIEWLDAVSKDSRENITYEVYYSSTQITSNNINLLTPIQKTVGGSSLNAVISGLNPQDQCWFAVRAIDSLGNVTTEYTTVAITPNVSSLEKREEETDDTDENLSGGSESFEGDISFDFDDEEVIDSVSKNEDEKVAYRTAKRTVYKNVSERSQVKYMLGIGLIVAGGVIVVAVLVLLIILLKKAKHKWIFILSLALAIAIAGVGIWLLFNLDTVTKRKFIETKEIPISTTEDNDNDATVDENESENENDDFDSDSLISDIPSFEYKGKTYYVSNSEGDDKNDGLTPETPIKTMEKLAELPLVEKDTVRFKCGDLWRGVNIDAIAGVTYSSYGEGEKPTFYGSKQNYAQASEWQSSGYLNIWVSTDQLGNIGSLSFNNDSEMAVYVHTEETNPGVLSTNGEFCYDWDNDKVYLYCDKGNPGEVYESIEALTENRIMYIYSGNTVENIKMKYANYGVQCWTGEDITVRNLDISYCGGTCAENGIRAGNAIEFWYNLENIVIENNVISNMYDTGITCQWAGDVSTDIVMKDIYVRNNHITKCHWSTEFWIYAQGIGQGVIENLNITNNYFGKAGEGWSTKQRNLTVANQYPYHIHGMSYDNYSYLDIKIIGNTFDCSQGALFSFQYQGYVPYLEGNTYIQYKNSSFGMIYGKMFTYNENVGTLLGVLEKDAIWKFAE